MTHKVESKAELVVGNLSYLYFKNPQELWQSDTPDEQHEDILAQSKRNEKDISVAGGITVQKAGRIIVDGFGSQSLGFPENPSQPIVELIKTLNGIKPENITTVG